MTERFTIPPDAKARLAMRERRDASHEAAARRSYAAGEGMSTESPLPGDDREHESVADIG